MGADVGCRTSGAGPAVDARRGEVTAVDATHRAAPVARLPQWAHHREAGRRLLVHGWALTAVVALAVGLLSQRFLLLPAVLGAGTVAALAGGRLRTWWWRRRRRAVGHPVVRAAAPRSLARGRPQPAGWPETLVNGSVHVTTDGWRWRPSPLCTDDVEERSWAHDEVAHLGFTPSWGPGLPVSGYVRLGLCHGGEVVLLVWDPDVLGLLEPLADDVAAQVGHGSGRS
jgi:hypothetical protein